MPTWVLLERTAHCLGVSAVRGKQPDDRSLYVLAGVCSFQCKLFGSEGSLVPTAQKTSWSLRTLQIRRSLERPVIQMDA